MYFCLVLANFYRVLKINKLMNRGRRLLRRKLITTRIKTKNKVSRLNLSNVSTFTGESVFLFIYFFSWPLWIFLIFLSKWERPGLLWLFLGWLSRRLDNDAFDEDGNSLGELGFDGDHLALRSAASLNDDGGGYTLFYPTEKRYFLWFSPSLLLW